MLVRLPKDVLDAFAALGRKGVKTRMKNTTPEQRSAIGRHARQVQLARLKAKLKAKQP